MLILSRKAGEAILMDGGIRIVVLASDNGGVRLGIEAPSHVGIVREEIVDRITEENRRAGEGPAAREWLDVLGGRRGADTPSAGDPGRRPTPGADDAAGKTDPSHGADPPARDPRPAGDD